MRVKEDQNTHTGFAMPEFPGYTGPASDQCWLIKVKAVTHRVHPIMQTCIGPSEEHVSMAGIPTEASIYGMVEKAMPGRRCFSLRSLLPVMKAGRDRQPFWPFPLSVN